MRALFTAAAALLLFAVLDAASAEEAHAHTAAPFPASIADWARGARRFEGLGTFHRAVTTSSPEAQQYFDQGMRFLWAFNHDEATRSFARAAELDPKCAACYWGVALTVGPNYNLPAMVEPRARVAFESLHRAQENAAHASAVEQALIAALAARYPSAQPLEPSNLAPVITAYAEAMRQVAARFPDDSDVQTLCAESEMTVNAWRLWTPEGQPTAGTPEIVARLEAVLRRDPHHPGANHYYIHVMEASPDPGRATASAERLTGVMPAAGHLEHMPAHIMQRIGRYEEAAEANRRGVKADQAYFAATNAPDYYAMYLAHNYAFLAYSASMEGRKAESLAAAQGAAQTVPLDMLLMMGDSGWMLSVPYAALVRFGLWDELIALGPPDPPSPPLTAGYLYGRGVALAARGRLDEARGALEVLGRLGAAEPESAAGITVARAILAARIAASERHDAAAVDALTQAVAAEDRLTRIEPGGWFFPVRDLLGAQLLIAGLAREAERVYREDLGRNPGSGWALYGLAAAQRAQGHMRAAGLTQQEFANAWKHADVRLEASAFWFAGPDTTSCECQRPTSAHR
jgi:tetratricopeptide (TPR) repeat protein